MSQEHHSTCLWMPLMCETLTILLGMAKLCLPTRTHTMFGYQTAESLEHVVAYFAVASTSTATIFQIIGLMGLATSTSSRTARPSEMRDSAPACARPLSWTHTSNHAEVQGRSWFSCRNENKVAKVIGMQLYIALIMRSHPNNFWE